MSEQREALTNLAQGARVMGSRMIRHDDPKKVTDDDYRDVIEQVRLFIDQNAVTNQYVARALGVSASVVSQLLKGTYTAETKWQYVIDLDRWLESERRRQDAARPSCFVSTSVAKRIAIVADYVVQMQKIGLVFGESGIGKTIALEAIAQDKPGSVYISLDDCQATHQSVIKSIGRALRVSTVARYGSASDWFEAIKLTLRGSGRLLIVDQVHKCCGSDPRDRVLYSLCDLHDATGAPQLWAGTIDMHAYLQRREGSGRQPLSQVRSRVAIYHDLRGQSRGGGDDLTDRPLFSIEEVRQVFKQSKLRLTRDAERYLQAIANMRDGGALRMAENVVSMATRVFEHKGVSSLTSAHLHESMSMLMVPNMVDQIEARLEAADQHVPALVKAG